MDEIAALCEDIRSDYAKRIGLDTDARYSDQHDLRPLPPRQCARGGIFILGAYPSARFTSAKTRAGHWMKDVPMADILGPFEDGPSGSGNDKQKSAKELDDQILGPLGLQRSQCWITNLVKVFLFKPGHVERFRALEKEPPIGYTRDRFHELGRRSLPWLEREISLGRPMLLITLGREVAGVLHDVKSPQRQTRLLEPEVRKLSVGAVEVDAIHCAHPGILMRKGSGHNEWPGRHRDEFVPVIKKFLSSRSPQSA